VLVWGGTPESRPAQPKRLFGPSVTVVMQAKSDPAVLNYHQLNLEIDGQVREIITVVVGCNFASAERK
jgi:hypothetical protein